MKQMVQIPYELEQEEDGTWGAHASFPSGGAHGVGDTPEEAVADLYEAVGLVIEKFGVPPVLTIVGMSPDAARDDRPPVALRFDHVLSGPPPSG
jgi:predicted RNase H-like HicB family nuclease